MGFDAADTAVAIATIRADESTLPPEQRLFTDPYAAVFCRHDPSPEATQRLLRVPYLREMVRLRTRFIDDAIRKAIADGIRQLVVLGVGYDCRGLRLAEVAESGTRVFSIDFAAQLARRARTLADAGVATSAAECPIAIDLAATGMESTLAAALAAEGFRSGAGAVFVWEGVIFYLDDAAVDRGLRCIARTGGRGTRLILNYETFRIDTTALTHRALAAGFASLVTVGCDELHRRFLGTTPPEACQPFRLALGRV